MQGSESYLVARLGGDIYQETEYSHRARKLLEKGPSPELSRDVLGNLMIRGTDIVIPPNPTEEIHVKYE